MGQLLELFDDMERGKRNNPRLKAINITTSLDYTLFWEEGERKNVLLLESRRYEIPEDATLYVLEDKVFVNNRTAFPVNQSIGPSEADDGATIVDAFRPIYLSENPEAAESYRLLDARPAKDEDRLDKRIPLTVFHVTDGRHSIRVEYFRKPKRNRRVAFLKYGVVEIYGREEDKEKDILGFVRQTVESYPSRVYFLPYYDDEYLFFFGKRKKITTDKTLMGDPDWFYIEKGKHPISAYKEMFFSYLRKRVTEIGYRMGLDLSKWEIKIGDFIGIFASNSYVKKVLRFDYRNAAYRKDIVDALIVHEVSHCYHHNHGRAFYALCERYWPNYHYYDSLLDNSVFNEKYLTEKEREQYIPF